MPYIGNPIYQSAFVTDTFSGNGSTTAFTMSVAPAGTTNVLVAISGVLQDPSTYGVVGTTITFSTAPPTGTGNISCRYLGIPVTGVTTTAYRTVTEFTATAGQTTFTPPSYTVGFINVYRNGVLLGSADYTATNGTTVVLTTGATAGDLVTVESFLVSSVLNALPLSGGNLSGNLNLTAGNLGFTSTAQRITGDFSNATVANNTMFQSSTTNGGTQVRALPNGTSAASSFGALNNSDPTNAGLLQMFVNATEGSVRSGITGTGTYLPLTMYTGGSERLRITTTGDTYIGDDKRYGFGGINNAIAGNTAGNVLYFITNSAERMRIDSSGNLLVGSSSSLYTTGRFNAMASSGTAGLFHTTYAGDTGTPPLYITKYDNVSTTSQVYVKFVYGVNISSGSGQINGNGPGAAAFGAWSDRRLKENIVDIPSQLEDICSLRPVEFDYIESEGGGHQTGFIAQEMKEVYPDAVGERDDGMLTVTGWDKTTARLVKAIQELKAELDATKAEVAALKAGK